ncbi:hypothetical protein ACFXEL_24795 [Streptomyces sp. NPDC059382]|uniref:hypothetical protein n=1 Tax=Streptomyces sp. NPDC059382 TaxID=3346816 RepID=UPI00369ACC8D
MKALDPPLTDDVRMAVRDFFTPAQLAAFADLEYSYERAEWGERQLQDPGRHPTRRLPGEPDEGCLCTWTRAPHGFTYTVQTATGCRSTAVSWGAVAEVIGRRLTPVRYGALRQAVDSEAAHHLAYHPAPAPFRDADMWHTHAYRPWTAEAARLSLRSGAAKDAILPAVLPQPFLF